LQSLELAALDQSFCLRPPEPIDDRIVIVGIDDSDISKLQAWPIPDDILAKVLEKIKAYQPRAIGLDIYRDVRVGNGYSALQQIFQTTPNLIGIEKLEDSGSVGVRPPATLAKLNQVGFNNVIVDGDGRIRRMLLFSKPHGETHSSFALRLALLYLQTEAIKPQAAPSTPGYLQLKRSIFYPLRPNDGGYVGADTGGYQVLANLRHPASRFRTVSLNQVLTGHISPDLMRDRIVLIGSTAPSLKDFFYTSYSGNPGGTAQPILGVELHGHFISQIIGAALEGRSLIHTLPKLLEVLWIFAWALIGASLIWKYCSPLQSIFITLTGSSILVGLAFLAFLQGWWLPLVPPLLTLVGSAALVTSYTAYLQEEFKKSKEFLSSVINTIPDPIFVKDQSHNWVVLNDAYCRFIGYPKEVLIEKSDQEFFPLHQVSRFWQQDELTFQTGIEHESEEEFTNAHGITYLIATKRSLHRDAAGNVFLVGVIRDITRRKQLEEELRQKAAELVRSNAELQQSEKRFRHLAYHDTLTGLPNRELFQERLHQAIQWAQTRSQQVALLFLDLDGFKQINDSYGHDIGNLLLKVVASRLTGCLRSSDTVARWGGDEFVILLLAIASTQDITRVAEKILYTLSQEVVLEDKRIPISTSIGISIYPHDTENVDCLLKEADLAMYRAKATGKNRYEFAHNH
jgi:diguanylate cyclase (GGDEF)-like protein/PAS domain S-box-containing protein